MVGYPSIVDPTYSRLMGGDSDECDHLLKKYSHSLSSLNSPPLFFYDANLYNKEFQVGVGNQ